MRGNCQCGAITFDISSQPIETYICHCLECQHQSSSAFGCSVLFPLSYPAASPPDPAKPESYLPPEFKSTSPGLVSVFKRSSDSGNTRLCYFCGRCGSRLVHVTPGGKMMSVKGGCIEGLDWKKAWEGNHLWVKRAVVDIPPEAKQWEGEPDD